MGSSNSKVDCLMRPGQSGKTRTMQEKIKEYELSSELFGGNGAVNIVICSNNRSLVEQTTARMDGDLFSEEGPSDDKIEGSCFSWTSGTKKNNVSVFELAYRVLNQNVSMVVCCAHKKRIEYLFKLLSELDKTPLFQRKINIWIDEADESIKLWSIADVDATRLIKVDKVTLVSATFNSIIEKYGRIRALPLVETHPACYHKVADCIPIEDDTVADTAVGYISSVFAKHEARLSVPGMRLFAPGNIRVASHDEVATFLQTKGYAVLILNGQRKCIVKPDGLVLRLDAYANETDPEEIGKLVAKLYHSNGLSQYPFAVTGHMCLGRGLTFQNDKFLFDFGIIPPIADDADAYQCACRMAGNIRSYPGYTPSTLITTTKMWGTIRKQENIAVNLGRLVYDFNLRDVGRLEIDVAAGNDRVYIDEVADYVATWVASDDLESIKGLLKGAKVPKKDKDGFYICNSTAKKGKHRLTYSELMEIKNGSKTAELGGNHADMKVGKEHGQAHMRVGYKDINNASTAVFAVKYVWRKNAPKSARERFEAMPMRALGNPFE